MATEKALALANQLEREERREERRVAKEQRDKEERAAALRAADAERARSAKAAEAKAAEASSSAAAASIQAAHRGRRSRHAVRERERARALAKAVKECAPSGSSSTPSPPMAGVASLSSTRMRSPYFSLRLDIFNSDEMSPLRQ